MNVTQKYQFIVNMCGFFEEKYPQLQIAQLLDADIRLLAKTYSPVIMIDNDFQRGMNSTAVRKKDPTLYGLHKEYSKNYEDTLEKMYAHVRNNLNSPTALDAAMKTFNGCTRAGNLDDTSYNEAVEMFKTTIAPILNTELKNEIQGINKATNNSCLMM